MKPTHRYRRIQVKNVDPPVALTLKDEIRVLDGGYCSLYSVNETPGMIIKLMNLVDEQIYQKFQQEVLAWSRMREEKPLFPVKQTKEGKYDSSPNIVGVRAAFRQMMKDTEMGVVVMEYCPKGSLESICGRLPAFAFKEIQIVKVAKDLLQGLCYLHCRSSPLIHRQVTMQHLLLGEDHHYKLVNFSHVTTHRYCKIKSDELDFIATEIKKHTCQGYRAPELIDIAQGSVIDERIDVFAGGVVLFQLSYGQPPFQGTIATLNSKVEIPDFPVYSSNLSELLKLMLTRDAKERPTSTKLLEYVLQNWNEFNITDEDKSPEQSLQKKQLGGLDMEIFSQDMTKAVPMKPTILNKFKKLVALKLQNKHTKGWILAALEENELPPKQKYVKLLILKAWQQPNKIEKFYDYLNLYVQTNCQSTVLTLKALLLLDEYIKKGPPAAVSVFKKSDEKSTALNATNSQQSQATVPTAQSILEKVIGVWEKKDSSESNNPSAKDKQRSGYATQLIAVLSATLMKKIELCSEYACILEGNFSLKPFFESIEKSYSNLSSSSYKPLSGKLMEDMLVYFAQLITLSHQILANNTLLNIQIALMLQLTEELYCFISTFTHLHSALIMSSNYLDSHIDKGQLKLKLDYISSSFEVNFNAARNYFNKAQTAVSHLGISKKSCFIPQIDQKIIEYIKAIPRLQDAKPNQQFYVQDYLNNNTCIYGLRLPISYGIAIGVNQSVNNAGNVSVSSAGSGGNAAVPAVASNNVINNNNNNNNNSNNSNNNSLNNLASLPTFAKGNSQSTYNNNNNNNDQKLDQLIEFKDTSKKSRSKPYNNESQRLHEQSQQLEFKSEAEEESKRNSQPGKLHLIFDPDNCNDDELQPQAHHHHHNNNPAGSNNPNSNLSQLVDLPHSTKASVSRYPLNQGRFHDKQVHSAERRTPQEALHRTQSQQPPWNQQNTQGTIGNIRKDHMNLSDDDDDNDDDYGCDFSQLVNENNNNYNDILDENDELQNFPLDCTHQSAAGNSGAQARNNNITGGNQRINSTENIPKNLGKFKDLQVIDFNQNAKNNINNSKLPGQQQQSQQQQLSSMSRTKNQSDKDKTDGCHVDHGEEFDIMEMDENNPTIQGAKEQGAIKRHDIGTLYQSVHNEQELPHASVTSSNYSSNSEHFIELKNFIINRVKHDPSELIIDFKSLKIGKKIGSGHSGKVFQGVWNNVEVAIKEMEVNQQNERNQKEFQREIETLVKISPQINLVSLIGVAQKKDNFYVITELCNGGSMFELLHKKQTTISLPWMHRLHMAKHIATGMIYLHSLSPPVIHRDLKSLNLLLDIEYREDSFDYNVKIADFGLARTESKGEMTQVLGTFHWMAPEVFQNKQYTTKADVYSYGIVLWEMINRKTPYSKLSTVEIMKCVCEGKRPEIDAIPEECPPLLVELMKDCWQQDYLLRPPFTVILERLVAIEADLKSRMNQQISLTKAFK